MKKTSILTRKQLVRISVRKIKEIREGLGFEKNPLQIFCDDILTPGMIELAEKVDGVLKEK